MPGVYISYPFCAQKCTYCNFASGVLPRELEGPYLKKLCAELQAIEWPWIPETVYWGGGTPSQIEPESFAHVMARIPRRASREVTIETAPGTVTPEKARAWRKSGVNRVSLGVQSFVEAEIRRTGRKHSAGIVEREIAILADAGITDINIDLIAGLAGQTRESWRESLDWTLRLGVRHVSVYMLEVDEDSRLGREMLLGGVRYGAGDVPCEELIAEMYETAADTLRDAGVPRYEISNFAAPGHESRHNMKYWTREPYLGFGADAHSFDGVYRWANVKTAAEYVGTDSPALPQEPAKPDEERFFLGLRLSRGIDASGVPHHRFEDEGLLERCDGRLRLTPRGILLSNEVFQEFIQ